MKKKMYIQPTVETEQVKLSSLVLAGSPAGLPISGGGGGTPDPIPSGGGGD